MQALKLYSSVSSSWVVQCGSNHVWVILLLLIAPGFGTDEVFSSFLSKELSDLVYVKQDEIQGLVKAIVCPLTG